LWVARRTRARLPLMKIESLHEDMERLCSRLLPTPVVMIQSEIPITTSTGESAGLWNTGYNEVFIADTGTAVAALALCHSLQPDADKAANYTSALEKYKLFVTKGCDTPPPIGSAKVAGVCPGKGKGWVLPKTDKNAGALGDGWYRDKLNSEPYTIATATGVVWLCRV